MVGNAKLGGGFKYCLFSSLSGEMIPDGLNQGILNRDVYPKKKTQQKSTVSICWYPPEI